MVPERGLAILREAFPDAVRSIDVGGMHPHAVVDVAAWRAVARFLRDDERLGFNWLRCISGVDHVEDERLTAVYELHAIRAPRQDGGAAAARAPGTSDLWVLAGELAIKVPVPRDAPHVPSVADIWPAANWHEREAADLLGFVFDGHPDPRRILCPDDWEGHPLRKDYEFPLEYHGIPAVTEYAMTRPRH